jgi:hypothetical protein
VIYNISADYPWEMNPMSSSSSTVSARREELVPGEFVECSSENSVGLDPNPIVYGERSLDARSAIRPAYSPIETTGRCSSS